MTTPATFLIDPATGRVRIPDLEIEMAPGMAEAEFLAATRHLNRDRLGSNDGWQRYSLRALISGDRKVGMFLIFLNGRLSKFSLAWAQKDETWDDWSEASERARQEEYRQELDRQLGGKDKEKGEFSWGRAWVIEDSKSGGTDIWIDYSPPAG
jgi:hypothetical protein